MKKDREEKTKSSENFAKSNNHCMLHQTSSTRNDYEQKINYDWPYNGFDINQNIRKFLNKPC